MKKLEKIGKSVLALSVLANTFMPLAVKADVTPVPATITFTVTNTAKYKITKNDHDDDFELVVTDKTDSNDQTNHTGIRIKSGNAEVNTGITATCTTENVTCKFEIKSVGQYSIDYNPGFIDISEGTNKIDDKANFMGNKDFSISQATMSPSFNGNATLIWTCGAAGNEICYKQLTGLSSSEVNWIKGSTIEAENKPGVKFDVHAKEKFFSPQDLFESKKADIDNGVIKVGNLKGPDGLDYMPVGEPIENNALVSYGNREFKAVVYGDEFKGITIGDLDSLDYYPQKWNDWFLRRETYDMSGTTKENPVEIDTVLLQKKINLKLQTDLNSYNVTKIEALDVPSNVVIITKKDDGSYDLDFKSNFYDKVVFKVSTDDNKEQFIYINRRTTDPWIRTDNGKEGLVVETFYDRNKSYSDLDVIAKIINKDGSSKVVHLEAERGIDNGLGDIIDGYEVDEQTVGNDTTPKGKGMKRANFVYSMSKDDLKKVDKIYINVGFKGSTETTYAGNFAGSGKGDIIDMKYWEDRL